MHGLTFLQDLAVVMIVAGVVTLLFHRIRQPVVLGYILAGLLIGPHTPPHPLVQDLDSIQTLADLGLVFLMFTLGLEFSLRKLRRVGMAALTAAACEILLMTWLGYEIGAFFHWKVADRFLLGVMMTLTSTAIVVKSLRDTGQLKETHGHIITGICIVEDIFIILVMVVLPTVARTGELSAAQLATTLVELFVFLVAAIVVGFLAVPRLLRYVARFQSDEMLLVTVLGLAFGSSLLAAKMNYSVALGAFLMGALVAESREAGRIETLTAPLRDLFSAVFFVAIGMLIQPEYIVKHAVAVLVVSILFMAGKIAACSFGTFVAGQPASTAMRVGTGMAQLGEFAVVVAVLGGQLHLAGDQLYPIVVAVAAVNAFLRPYLVDNSDRLTRGISHLVPSSVAAVLHVYSRWAGRVGERKRKPAMRQVRNLAWQLVMNVTLVAAIFIVAAFLARFAPPWLREVPRQFGGPRTVYWMIAVLCSLPIYVATVRKMQALSMILGEIATSGASDSEARGTLVRTILTKTFFVVQIAGLVMLTVLLSSALLPPVPTLAVLLAIVTILILFFGHSFNNWYSRAKFAFTEAWNQPLPSHDARPLPALLRDAHLETVNVGKGQMAGRLIRELQLRTATGASIVAIERGGRTIVNPGPDDELKEGDRVLLLGDERQLAKAVALFGGQKSAGA